jgi:ABC-type multidrug transport system fused ATPase/permease subunit
VAYLPLSDLPVPLSTRQLMGDLRQYLRPYRGRFWLGSLLAAFSSLVWLSIPWAFGQIITESATYQAGEPVDWAWKYLAWIGLASLGYYAAQEIARFLVYLVANKASIDLQKKTLRQMVRLNLDWHETENSGNKLKKINRGGDSLQQLIQLYVNLGIDTLVSLIGIMVIFSLLHWQLNLLLIVFFVIQYGLGVYLTGRAREQARRVNHTEEEFEGIKFELLNNIRTVKTLDMGLSVLDLVGHKTTRLIGEIRKRIILFRTRLAILGINQQLFRLLVMGFAIWQVIQGNFEVGLIAQVYFYFGKIESTAKSFADIYHQLVLIRINLSGAFEILRKAASVEEAGSQSYPQDWRVLRVEDLHFSYGEKAVLTGIAGEIRRGEKIGIVGASGAGKTSLFRLLQKLSQDYEGQISLDGLSLHDIRRSTFAPHIGVVLQETELFNLSIRENITLGHEAAGGAETQFSQALFLAGLDEMVAKLPQGADTVVGEKGVKLSGGERQRLGIARALYRQPQLLFMDESTSQLDSELEARIQQRLHEADTQTTALVIAHRLASLRHVDQIWVLEAGKIVEKGSFAELLTAKGLFYQLWEQQAREEGK